MTTKWFEPVISRWQQRLLIGNVSFISQPTTPRLCNTDEHQTTGGFIVEIKLALFLKKERYLTGVFESIIPNLLVKVRLTYQSYNRVSSRYDCSYIQDALWSQTPWLCLVGQPWWTASCIYSGTAVSRIQHSHRFLRDLINGRLHWLSRQPLHWLSRQSFLPAPMLTSFRCEEFTDALTPVMQGHGFYKRVHILLS